MTTFEIVLLVVAIIASLLVAIQLLFRLDSNKYAVGLLAAFMFLQALLNGMFLLVQSGLVVEYWYLYRVFAPLGFLVPSLVYLYLSALLKDQTRPRLIDILHLIPAVGMLINYIPYFRLSTAEKQQVVEAVVNDYTVYVQGQEGFLPESWVTVLRLLLPIIYIPLYYHVLRSTRSQFDQNNPFDKQLRNWAWIFTHAVIAYLGGVMIFLTVYLVPQSIAMTQAYIQLMSVVSVVTFIFWAGSFLFFGLYQILNPAVGIGYMMMPHNRDSNGKSHTGQTSLADADSAIQERELSPSLTETPDVEDEEIRRVRDLFVNQSIWKTPDIIVSDIAREAQISVRKTSYIINRYFGGNTNTVINRYRVGYVKTLIAEGYLENYSLSGLYKECGFKNKVTFFNAFKRETGMTPSEFRAQKAGSH